MKTGARWAILIFSFLGLADSIYLAQHALEGIPPTCTINGVDGCSTVAQSAYGHLFGIPVSIYGVAFYAIVFALMVGMFFVTGARATRAVRWLTVLGAIASLVFLGVQFFLIKAMCLYCETSAVLTFLMFAVAWWPSRGSDSSASTAESE